MPGSARENDRYVQGFVIANKIKTVLDVGAGAGTYAMLLGGLVDRIDAIEVWDPYVVQFDLRAKYNRVYRADARTFVLDGLRLYDLVIFGDVLEHMTQWEAQQVWSRFSAKAAWGLISVPVIHSPQGPWEGNPFEVHVQEDLAPEQVREIFGPFDHEQIYPVTGTFIRRFAEPAFADTSHEPNESKDALNG